VSVRLSGCDMLNIIMETLSLSDRTIILVFRHQGLLRKLDGFTPNRGAKYKVIDFISICSYISETVIDRGRPIFTMEDELNNINSHVFYRIVPLSMTLSVPELQFQGHSIHVV